MAEDKSENLLLWLVAIGFFMETLDSTIVNTALPSMARSLHESPLFMYSVVIAYSLTIAVLIPASGWVADRFGTRLAFFSAILLFSVGSLFCASSHNLTQLVISRVIQGTGGAMLLPIGRLAVLREFPRQKFLQAMSFVAIPGLIGPLIGPTLGGWLVEIASWHWIFLINIPIGIVGGIVTFVFMPDSRLPQTSRFDLTGYLLLALSMVSISFSLDGLSELGMRHATVVILMIFGLSCLAAYWLHAAKKQDPLFSLELFKSNTFSIGLLGNLFARIGSGSMPFLIPLFMQISLGHSPLQAGTMMIPVAIASMFAKRLVIPLVTHIGYRPLLMINTFLVGLAMASFTWVSREQSIILRIIQLALYGAVSSLQFTVMNTLTLKDLEGKNASSGNSLFSMVQMLAMSLGVAAAGALLSLFSSQLGSDSPETSVNTLRAFHATFICMGMITCTSACIFWQLSPQVKVGKKQKTAKEEMT